MNNLKSIENNFKTDDINTLIRKKTYDPSNIIDLDTDISVMDTHIKKIPCFLKRNTFIEKLTKKRIYSKARTLQKKKKLNRKLDDYNSITTTTSYGEKSVKKVTFSTIEIIRVENYKKYNKILNFSKKLIKKNMEEVNKNKKDSNCLIF